MAEARTPLNYGRQWISDADVRAVEDVLQSDWLTQGPAVPAFERALAESSRAGHAVAVSSATAALHIACLALDLGPGDVLWTSPNSFVASANCALYCGARVDFVDIDPGTRNMSIAALEQKLQIAERTGALPKIIVPVHFAGISCDMAAIAGLVRPYGIRIIEDASHALGASYGAQPVGSCLCSDITVFSFHPVKIVTTGEGGAALTNNSALAERLRLLRSHGITREPALMIAEPDGPWSYEQIMLGFNYRMTDIQAALGRSQLDRLASFVRIRNDLADHYDRLLKDVGLQIPARPAADVSAMHLYVVTLASSKQREGVFRHLRTRDIFANVHYIPIHLQPYYRALGFQSGDFPVAEDHYRRCLTLPLHPQMAREDVDFVVATMREAVE